MVDDLFDDLLILDEGDLPPFTFLKVSNISTEIHLM